jgi:hypothetical protein
LPRNGAFHAIDPESSASFLTGSDVSILRALSLDLADAPAGDRELPRIVEFFERMIG